MLILSNYLCYVLISKEIMVIVKGFYYVLHSTTLASFYMPVQIKHDWCITNTPPICVSSVCLLKTQTIYQWHQWLPYVNANSIFLAIQNSGTLLKYYEWKWNNQHTITHKEIDNNNYITFQLRSIAHKSIQNYPIKDSRNIIQFIK